MKRMLCVFALAMVYVLTGWSSDRGFVVTEQVGADEVVKEKKVERSVKVVPYVEPPRAVAPVGGSGGTAAAAANDCARGSRCAGGKCRSVGKSVKKAVSRLRHR